MADTYPAFDISPVPTPAVDAEAPELFHGLYSMPMFVTLPTADLAVSVDFWTRGLGFFVLFTVPNQITHPRRWAFQDVLLVPGERPAAAPAQTVSFSCVLSQIDQIAADCERLVPGCTTGPRRMPRNSVELEIRTHFDTEYSPAPSRPMPWRNVIEPPSDGTSIARTLCRSAWPACMSTIPATRLSTTPWLPA